VDHSDHVALLAPGLPRGAAGEWADLGSGGGAFTLALADLLGPRGRIHSIDRDSGALRRQREAMRARFPAADVRYVQGDFTRPLELPPLDGVVMANSLHFVRHKGPVLSLVRGYLKPGGRLILVEYDSDRGNPWVPHPLSYPTWERLSLEAGFSQTRLLARRPSSVLGAIYSALSLLDGAAIDAQPDRTS
jgi:ubiquinone/menaquinone biosynthesis C-methylase UbiE